MVVRAPVQAFHRLEFLPPVSLTCLAAILVAAGTVFTVEFAQRIFADEYRALAVAACSLAPVDGVWSRMVAGFWFTWALPTAFSASAHWPARPHVLAGGCWKKKERARDTLDSLREKEQSGSYGFTPELDEMESNERE